MSAARVIRTADELASLDLAAIPARPEPRRVLMCTPDHFDVIEVKNAHMLGQVGMVDRGRARAQWEALRKTFEAVGYPVVAIAGAGGLEDMVFAANPVLTGMGPDGRPYVVLGKMCHPSRQREVPHYRAWFERHGYRVVELSDEAGPFEGMGDAIWHPGRMLLWGGHGQRTSLGAYGEVAGLLGVPVVALELVHPAFYHLDTAFCALAEDAVLVYPGAFSAEGLALIRAAFPRVLEADEGEAAGAFACNAVALGGGTVVIQRGAPRTVAALRAEGFGPVEVDTSEFMKSGGSVFCMKQMIY